MWCLRKTEISWTDHVNNGEVLQRVKDHPVYNNMKGAFWNGYALRRNRLVKPVTKRDIERVVRRGRRRKQLLNDLKEKRIY